LKSATWGAKQAVVFMNTIGMEKEKPNQRPSQMKATGMKARHIGLKQHCCTVLIALAISAGITATAPYALAQTITCDETVLSVNATDIKAEDLIKAIGNECGIKMVLRGELFTEDVFSVRFENMPIRTGLERILRVVNIPNHMIHFEAVSGHHRVIEVDLIGEKGGERQLTPEEDRISQPAPEEDQISQPTPEEAEKRPERKKKRSPSQRRKDKQQKKPMTLPEETEESQREEDKEPNRDELRVTLQQELPVEMQDQIPEEELNKMEQLTDE